MKNTQNEKILQIKNETLVVGIDIGKDTHYARAFDFRGIEQSKLLRFSNTNQGYEALDSWMQEMLIHSTSSVPESLMIIARPRMTEKTLKL